MYLNYFQSFIIINFRQKLRNYRFFVVVNSYYIELVENVLSNNDGEKTLEQIRNKRRQ